MKVAGALLEGVRSISHEAGKRIMGYYRQDTGVVLKSDLSPLTKADRASHYFLAGELPSLLPSVPVISEESPRAPAEARVADDLFWLVDPLDGTKEFIKGTREFTVNVALVQGGRPILGVVHAPALDLTYSGSLGSGAWRQQDLQAPEPIRTRGADLSKLSVVASKDHAGPLVEAMLARLPSANLRSMGSSLKFCLVAEGEADLYLRDLPTMEWDTAAAQCIVEAASGGVYDLLGISLAYGKPDLRNGPIVTVGDVNFPWRELICRDVRS